MKEELEIKHIKNRIKDLEKETDGLKRRIQDVSNGAFLIFMLVIVLTLLAILLI